MKIIDKIRNLSTSDKYLCIIIAIAVTITVCIVVRLNTKIIIKFDLPTESSQVAENQPAVNENITNTPAVTENTTSAPVTENTTASGTTTESTTASGTTAENTTAAPENTTAANNNAGTAITAKEDIIALYNTAVNKVKTEATKVTRNFRNCRYDADKSVLPSAVAKMGNPMMEKYVKDDTEPVEYLTKEEIIENFPVPKQEYSSKLTAADVTKATCVDNGTEYEITLYLADSTNPTAGVGVGAGCHFMDTTSITSNEAAASMIKKFDAIYEGCVIKCKIDKATNRVTWANFYTPFTIDAVVNIIVELSTTVVMSYERDYTITY